MSIGSAFSIAATGLATAGRASQVVSANIANAMTEGYGRRSLALSSDATTGGVQVRAVVRHSDPGLISNRRSAEAEYEVASAVSAYLAEFENLIGATDDPASLTMRVADLEVSLLSAASRPESSQRLGAVAQDAKELASTLNKASEDLQSIRERADHSIDMQINELNTALKQVQQLNSKITAARSSGGDPLSLEDKRQTLIDQINTIVPIKQIARDHGQVALYTERGAILLDGPAAEVEFTPTGTISAELSVAGGHLSGLTVNGFAINTENLRGPLSGGSLSAQFHIRDDLAVEAQAQLDSVARDLIERFQNPATDPSLSIGDPGLFTDRGAAFVSANETGIASRISLHDAVNPDQGGEVWRLQSGLNATTPSPIGDATILQSLHTALTATRTPASGSLGNGAVSASGLSSALLTDIGIDRISADQELSFTSGSLTEMIQIELANGVDTDAEVQNLLMIERAYSANARVIETIDEMLQSLLRI
jgi:flagellar hook-associated protein 1 FlgK